VWDATTGETLSGMSHDWHPRGLLLLTVCNHGFVRVWDAETGDLRLALSRGDEVVFNAYWSADGTQILSRTPARMGDGCLASTHERTLRSGV
jgi:WD40 repeat protein